MASDLPKNAHVSSHPCLQAKLSQLRSASTGCRDAQTLVHEIALMVGYEALGAGLAAQQEGTVRVSLPSNLQYQERKWGYTALQVYLANSIHTKHSY
jgi:uracil phosphoribosyltransferase